jgi:Helix-turn-helix domain
MMQPMQPPCRMRFSWESRCRMVGLIEAGMRPGEAAAVCGASRATGYRLWARYRQGGWAAPRPPRGRIRAACQVTSSGRSWRSESAPTPARCDRSDHRPAVVDGG